MRVAALCALILSWIFVSVAAGAAPAADSPVGVWEGESKCAVHPSPCHDEHVIYEIAPDPANSSVLKMDGFKVVHGQREFTGSLNCAYAKRARVLECTFRGNEFDDWRFTLSGNTLRGTLHTNGGKTLYRTIVVHKRSSTQTQRLGLPAYLPAGMRLNRPRFPSLAFASQRFSTPAK